MVASELKEDWTAFKEANPRVRIRDAAYQLGVSEAKLLATDLGESVVRLKPDWYNMLKDKEGLGTVMALTRNELFVHEKVGPYTNITVMPDHKMGQTLGDHIDLRIFFKNWHYGFAVTKEQRGEMKRSLQYFDQYGQAVHKTHLRPESSVEHYDEFVSRYRHEDQEPNISFLPPAEPEAETPDEDIDHIALQQAWGDLKDTHDFIFMLRKFKVSRLQAFRLAGETFARQVDTSSFRFVLESAAQVGLPIMVFVNNPGCIQIHTGPIHTLKETRGWYNILDPGFNLHVKDQEIAATWVVKKPVDTGIVHSLECYDRFGRALCYIFGKRKEGIHELEAWREILNQV